MKPKCSTRRRTAMTLIEAVVIILVISFLTMLLLPALLLHPRKSSKIGCVNNLKQTGLAFKIWAGDNNDKYPMQLSVTNGGTMELMDTADAWKTFQVMSNELSTPRVLICPEDSARWPGATNWGDSLKNKISYFISMDAADADPNSLISGDDNFETNGVAVKRGRLELSTNSPPAWTTARHNRTGNLLLGDGSIQSMTSSMLKNFWQQTGLVTNRIFVP